MSTEEVVDVLLEQNWLPLDDVYALLSVSKTYRDKLTNKVVKSTLCLHPLRGRNRFNWWVIHLLQASAESPKLQNLYTGDCLYHYLSLIQQLGVARASTNTPGQIGEVMRDVKRTFPTHPFFLDGMPGQDMLARILQAGIVSQPDVGYCQGMNFVVGSFILSHPICSECPERVMSDHVNETRPNLPASGGKPSPAKFWAPAMHFNLFNLAEAESEIYVALMCLLDADGKLNMQCAWRTGMPVMRLYNYQFDRLLKWNFPHLHGHFIEIGFSPEILLSQWFLTFFIYTFPLEMCLDMWDYIMAFGWPSIFSFALAFCGIMENKILEMDLEELSIEMRKWKCDKFELPAGVTFKNIVDLAISISVSDSELMTLQEAFASKLVSDAAASTNTVVQPHLGVKDLAQLTKSIGRYLKKNNHPANHFVADSSRVSGVGLMSPFSHSGFLETPIEDFNSVANFNEKVQKELSAVFAELVELNKQVESDKEVYLFKIVNTSQKLDSLKNELEVISTKETVANEAFSVIKSELALALEAEAQSSLGGSIHNSLALGLGSSHGHSSHGIGSSMHGNRDGMLLTAPYRDIEIQSHGSVDSNDSPGRGARKSPRAAPTASNHGVLDIVAFRHVRFPKHGDGHASPANGPTSPHRSLGRPARRHSQGQAVDQPDSPNKLHIRRTASDSPGRPPMSPPAPPELPMSPQQTQEVHRTRRYIRGKVSPAKPVMKQSSFEDIDLSDPGDIPSSATDTSMSSACTDVSNLDKLGSTTAVAAGSRWSFFSRKTATPPSPGGLLQAVKTGRRASYIMEHELHQESSAESALDGASADEGRSHSASTSSEATSRGDSVQSGHGHSGHGHRHRGSKTDASGDEAILKMMSASTTKFIPDPALHPEAGTLGNVLGIAAHWTGSGKKDSIALQSELEATESNLKELAMRIMEINTCIEEETEKKDRLCEQLQLLMEEMFKKRTVILRNIIRRYVMATDQ